MGVATGAEFHDDHEVGRCGNFAAFASTLTESLTFLSSSPAIGPFCQQENSIVAPTAACGPHHFDDHVG